jgi:hypothetical protein
MSHHHISHIHGLIRYISENSNWSPVTVRHVVTALGYSPNGGFVTLKGLSSILMDCAQHGADGGFPGFSYYDDTLSFFKRNRQDIVKNLELTAEKLGEDIIKLVQSFGVFRCDVPPSPANVSRALWGTGGLKRDLTGIYNVFAWFCFEEVSRIWYRYLEENPAYYAELSA